MKRVFCKLIGIIGIVVVCVSCNNLISIEGNGDLVTSEKSFSEFKKITCGGSAEVRFYVSEAYRAVVTVDANLDEYVEISTKNNTLHIGTQKGYNCKFTKFLVDIYYPVLADVSISGSGSFEGVDKINTSTFAANVSGSGKIGGSIECDSFSASVSGSGRITATGTCEDASITISGSGNFNGNEFEAKNAAVTLSGSGKAEINVTDKLNAKISGSGGLTYRGDPQIESTVSGSGRIRKLSTSEK